VYGSISHGSFDETAKFNPSSPYSASKAGAEHLVQAARNSFGLNINIVRCSNNFGPRQFPEKLIPLAISRIFQNQKIPIFGDGNNSREWLYVEDCCRAIKLVLENGSRNSVYNISSGVEHTNLFVVRKILQLLGKGDELLEYVADRKGHDFRYSIDSTKIINELGWAPTKDFEEGMCETVNWYVKEFKGDQNG
jgi:dTDP-glucose 4,6-dehydratase